MDNSTIHNPASIEAAEIIVCDNARALMLMPEASVDLIFTSPPYNLGQSPSAKAHPKSSKGSSYNHKGYLETFADDLPEELYQALQIFTINEMYRVLKPEGSLMYVHKDRLWNGVSISPRTWLEKTIFTIRQQIVWDQGDTHQNNARYFAPTYEWIFWMVREDFTSYELPQYMKALWSLPNNTARQRQPKPGKPKHPAQFPADLAAAAIRQMTNEGDLVLDPYCGVGNTGLAARKLNRRFLGLELNKYFAGEARDAVASFTPTLL